MTGPGAQPTGYWAVDLISADDGTPIRPQRQGVFTEAAAREFIGQRRAHPQHCYRVAQLWQGRREDGSLLPAYVPADVADGQP